MTRQTALVLSAVIGINGPNKTTNLLSGGDEMEYKKEQRLLRRVIRVCDRFSAWHGWNRSYTYLLIAKMLNRRGGML